MTDSPSNLMAFLASSGVRNSRKAKFCSVLIQEETIGSPDLIFAEIAFMAAFINSVTSLGVNPSGKFATYISFGLFSGSVIDKGALLIEDFAISSNFFLTRYDLIKNLLSKFFILFLEISEEYDLVLL